MFIARVNMDVFILIIQYIFLGCRRVYMDGSDCPVDSFRVQKNQCMNVVILIIQYIFNTSCRKGHSDNQEYFSRGQKSQYGRVWLSSSFWSSSTYFPFWQCRWQTLPYCIGKREHCFYVEFQELLILTFIQTSRASNWMPDIPWKLMNRKSFTRLQEIGMKSLNHDNCSDWRSENVFTVHISTAGMFW